jgi:hypothetical protein
MVEETEHPIIVEIFPIILLGGGVIITGVLLEKPT